MEKYVSIIIPTYNRMEKLKRSINSILRQTYPYFELLIVDDASTDQTETMVQSFDDSRIRYIKSEKNVGPAAARNIGIKNAKYEYIAFQDSDDIWLDDKLEKQMGKMQSNTEFGMVYCAYYLVRENKKVKIPSDRFPQSDLEGDIFQSLWQENKIGTPSILVKRQCIERVGGFDETLHSLEDWEFVLRIASQYKIGYVNEILVNAIQSEAGVNSNRAAQVATYYFLIQHYEKKGFDISTKISAMMNAMTWLNDEDVDKWEEKMITEYFKDGQEFRQSLKSARESRKDVIINRLLTEISNTCRLTAFLRKNMDLETDAVAVYGAGIAGEFLAHKLVETGIKVSCIFDKNNVLLEGFLVQKPCLCNGDTSAVIVTIAENINCAEFQEWAGNTVKILNIYDMLNA